MGISDHWGGRPRPPRPIPEPMRGVGVFVVDRGRGVANADLFLGDDHIAAGGYRGRTDASGWYVFRPVRASLNVSYLTVTNVSGKQPYSTPRISPGLLILPNRDVNIVVGGQAALTDISLSGLVSIRPPFEARAPLPPFPPGQYDHTFTQPIPPNPDKLWHRGNFCGIRIPGAPPVPGGRNATLPGRDTDLMMEIHFDLYPQDWQDAYLDGVCRRGYTHVQRTFTDPRGRRDPAAIRDYVAMAKRVQAPELYADHWFIRKTTDPRDADASYYKPELDPLIDALLAERAIDTACVGWELDLFNAPGRPLQSIIDYLTDRLGPHDIPLYVHFSTAGTWWGSAEDGTPDRFAWWRRQRNKLTGIHYQADTSWDIGTMQARLCDTLNPFGGDASKGVMGESGFGRPFQLVAFETSAEKQFYDQATEDDGDLVNYLLLCTQAATPVAGFGNGARFPNGEVL